VASGGFCEHVEAHAPNIPAGLYACKGMYQGWQRALAWMAWRR
jgi:hypothetical protein